MNKMRSKREFSKDAISSTKLCTVLAQVLNSILTVPIYLVIFTSILTIILFSVFYFFSNTTYNIYNN
jgi:hypothetical protein